MGRGEAWATERIHHNKAQESRTRFGMEGGEKSCFIRAKVELPVGQPSSDAVQAGRWIQRPSVQE